MGLGCHASKRQRGKEGLRGHWVSHLSLYHFIIWFPVGATVTEEWENLPRLEPPCRIKGMVLIIAINSAAIFFLQYKPSLTRCKLHLMLVIIAVISIINTFWTMLIRWGHRQPDISTRSTNPASRTPTSWWLSHDISPKLRTSTWNNTLWPIYLSTNSTSSAFHRIPMASVSLRARIWICRNSPKLGSTQQGCKCSH